MSYIDNLITKAKEAQSRVADYSQSQVDALVKAIGKVIYDHSEALSKEAVEETGYGTVEGKMAKHSIVCIATWVYLRDKPSVGIIEEDVSNGIVTYAKPVGVVACLTPSTNPTTTVANNVMNIVKTRNAVIVAPHPKAKKCTAHSVALIREALMKLGAPEDLVQVIEEPSMPGSQELMSKADLTVATGGFGMIKAAYASGRPCYGVGQGNVQTIIAEDYTDYDTAAKTILDSRCFDNGVLCIGDQSLYFPKAKEKELVDAFKAQGAYLLEDDDKVEKLAALLFKDSVATNPAYVGMAVTKIAPLIGLALPEGTRALLIKARGVGTEHLLCKEKLCPIMIYYTYDDLKDVFATAKTNLKMEGSGHTSVIFTNDKETARLAGEELPVGRMMVNQPALASTGGSLGNGLSPSMSLGCGSWGNNIISENLSYRHLMNVTKLSFPKENTVFPSAEEAFGE